LVVDIELAATGMRAGVSVATAELRFGYNQRLGSNTRLRSMKVVQLICNHQVLVRFRPEHQKRKRVT
jgi:hypothetical protein